MKSLCRLMALATLAGGLAAVPASGQVVISQVFGVPTGGTGGSTYSYEVDYIELFNRGNTPVDMSGWSVQAEWLGDWEVIPLTGTLQPGQFFLIQVYERQPGTTNTGAPLPTPDLIAQASGGGFNNPDSTWLSGSQGGVALMSNTLQIASDTCPDSDPALLDLVAWGSTILTCGSGATNAGQQTNSLAILRKNDGCTDTNNSAADFELKAPKPRNTAFEYPYGLSTNINSIPALPGGSITITARGVSHVCGFAGNVPLTTATVDLSSVGGSSALTMSDDGVAPDVTAGDNIWTVSYTIPGGTTLGSYPVSFALSGPSGSISAPSTLVVASTGDFCANAKPLDPATFPFVDSLTLTNFTDDALISPCRSVTTPTASRFGWWYSITPATDMVVQVRRSTSVYNLSLHIGSCGSTTIIDCDDTLNVANFRLTAGVPYKIFSFFDSTGVSPTNGTLTFSLITPTANDLCNGAIDLNAQGLPGSTYTDTNLASMQNGTNDHDITCDTIPLIANRGVWYTYLPPTDSVLKLNETTSGFNTCNSLWTGTCPGGLTQVGCSTVENNSYALTAGVRYYVMVSLNSSASPSDTSAGYNNTFSVVVPPANDQCANATPVGSLATPFTESTTLNNSSADTPTCGTSVLGIWYTFTAPQTGALRLNESATASNADISWNVLTACTGGTSLLCTSTDTDQFANVNAGQQVYILLYGSATAVGTLNVNISFIPAPANDTCAVAEVVTAFPFNTQPDARGAINNDADVGPCSTQTSTAYGLWYTLTAPVTGYLTVAETSAGEGDVGVWSVSNPADPCNSIVSQIGCDTDETGVFPASQGTTYLILIGNSTSSSPSRPSANYNITINVVQPYANDACAGAQVIPALPVLDLTLPTFYADSGPRVSCEVPAATVHNHSLWYAYTPASDETITIWDTSTTKSLAIALFKDSCAAPEEACGTNDVTFNLTAGHTYYIVVGTNLVSPDSSTGQYRLNFVRSQRFTNDTCDSASPINQTPFSTIIDLSTATNDAVPALACSSNTTNVVQGAWYKIQTLTAGQLTGSIEVDYARANSGVAALFRSIDGSCGNLDPTPVVCGTDPTSVPLVIDLNSSLADNTTYYLIVGLPGATSDDFVISIDNLNYSGTLNTGTQTCCRGTTCNPVASGSCTGSVAGSNSLVVSSCGAGGTFASCCYADFNHDGIQSIDDLFLYFNAYFTSSPYSNVGGDGVATPTIDDLFLYINAYFGTCS